MGAVGSAIAVLSIGSQVVGGGGLQVVERGGEGAAAVTLFSVAIISGWVGLSTPADAMLSHYG